MKDRIKQEFKIGDFVAFNPPNFKGLEIGVVEKFTPKGLTIRYNNTKCNRSYYDCIIITEQIQLSKEKNPEEWI